MLVKFHRFQKVDKIHVKLRRSGVDMRWTPSSDQLETKLSYGAGVDVGLVFLALMFKIELRRFANLGR